VVIRGTFLAHRPWRAIAWPLGLGALVALLTVANAGAARAGATEYLQGIDVSHFQGQPDWVAVKADGIRFAFLKATEARTFVDDQYATNRANADAAGVPVGAYHFARPGPAANDAVNEADHFLDNAALKPRNLLPVLDLEDDGGLGIKAIKQWAKAWLARVDERLGVKAIIYTSPSFWRDEVGNTAWFANNGYRLWIAHWGADQPDVPARNWDGRGWTLWQYDDCGSVAGINGCVDRDHLAGTVGALRIKNN
jgi:lysozyme